MNQVENRKVIVVTGGGQGIGKAICLHFAQRNFDIAVIDKNFPNAIATAHEAREFGVNAQPYECNITNSKRVSETFSQIHKDFGRVDILVNNAGVFFRETIEESTDDIIDTLINVNLKGMLFCTRAVIPIMKAQRSGNIINACSILGAFPDFGLGVYGATKSGVAILTRVLAAELAPYGIRVNAYQPAVTDTPMVHHIIVERPESKLSQIPLRRFGKPEEIARLVWFLTSEEADYITGQVIPCDGGIWSVQRPMEPWIRAGLLPKKE
ncbi:MAG: SDR family oxidoreductase [Caldiserica bacterium]|jgi:3-oxoacyl-[acyl-carrier protein] reductase|nr:SDR family oxidoreductase [Caldisericota bacterium]MDH7563242.1 SDR family oxidoreductase [Caldisericota bacterium]